MKEENITQSIISAIKDKKIKPRARWGFIFKNYFLWFIGVLALLFGALSFSLFIYIFNISSLVFYYSFINSIWEFVFAIIPIFWLLSLMLFLYLSYLNFKRTKKGYKYSPVLVIILSVFLSILLAYLFNFLGFTKQLDLLIARNINTTFYSHIVNPQIAFWSDPSKGRLSGFIVLHETDNQFVLIDKNEDEWIIDYRDAVLRNILILEEGLFVKSFGEQLADKQFRASVIMPMHSGQGVFKHNKIKANMLNACLEDKPCHRP